MTVIVDAMGGDNAPLEIIKGASLGEKELGVDVILCGDGEKIRACAAEKGVDISRMEIIHATESITMEDDPMTVLRGKNSSSMALGLKALAQKRGDAFVSAGNTGALTVGGTFTVKRIKGVSRAAIGAVLPSEKAPFMLIDTGANLVCTPEQLRTFALMGSVYMNKICGVNAPKVGLANIGTEPTKGTPLQTEAYELLKTSSLNFVGNTEARDIPFGAADVITADGFTGNIILKTYEGTAKYFSGSIKSILKRNPATLFGGIFVKSGFDALKKKMDYKELGGAPLLGLRRPVIKAHGSSDATAFKNAMRQAAAFTQRGVIGAVAQGVWES